MATVNIKRIASEAIASYLASNVAGLSGLVSAVQEGPEKVTTFPSVCLLPSTFVFNPADPDEVANDDDAGDDPLVLDVGEFEGTIELQLYANNKPMRELFEQRILDLFLSQEGSPGTLFVDLPELTINGEVTLYAPTIKVRLANEEWAEEFAFENRRYSFIDLEVAFPALTTLTAHTIEELEVLLTHSLDSDEPYESPTLTPGWPLTADALSLAMGNLGRWAHAWKFDLPRVTALPLANEIFNLIGSESLFEPGGASYMSSGVFMGDNSVELTADNQGFGGESNTFLDLGATDSFALLFCFTLVGVPPGTDYNLSSKGSGSTYRRLWIDSLGRVNFEVCEGGNIVGSYVNANHYDGIPHYVLAIIDRTAQMVQVFTDLGASQALSIASLGALVSPTEPWSLGTSFDLPSSSARMKVHYAAVAFDGIPALRANGSAFATSLREYLGVS